MQKSKQDVNLENESVQRALKKFLLDKAKLEQIGRHFSKNNIFSILKMDNTEIRHSNFLAWILDPSQNPKLANAFLHKIFAYVAENSAEDVDTESVEFLRLLNADLRSARISVFREKEHTDILLVSEKQPQFLLCIENKVNSKQRKGQLPEYRKKILKEWKNIPKERCYCLFLTKNDEIPEDNKWIPIHYDDLACMLDEIVDSIQLDGDVKNIVKQYVETLRKNDMANDEELQKIATEIYKEHKEALEYIMKFADNDESRIFRNVVLKWAEENKKVFTRDKKTGASILFTTKDLDALLSSGMHNDDTSKWWAYFAIDRRNLNKITLVLHRKEGFKEDVLTKLDKVHKKIANKNENWEWCSKLSVQWSSKDSLLNNEMLRQDYLDKSVLDSFFDKISKSLDSLTKELKEKLK